jgi:hypothetical protein
VATSLQKDNQKSKYLCGTSEYVSYVGHMIIYPGTFWEWIPYSSVKLTIESNPDFDGQTIYLPHSGGELLFTATGEITEDMPNISPGFERWDFMVKIGQWEKSLLIIDEKPENNAGNYFLEKSFTITSESKGFEDGQEDFVGRLQMEYRRYYLVHEEDSCWWNWDEWHNKEVAGTITIIIENEIPTIPHLTGPNTLKENVEGLFTAVSTDSDCDTIEYGWDWDANDEVDYWTEPYISGENCSIVHKWKEAGTYVIQVKARDIHSPALETNWAMFTVNVEEKSKSKAGINLLLHNLLARYPNLPLFQLLLKL